MKRWFYACSKIMAINNPRLGKTIAVTPTSNDRLEK